MNRDQAAKALVATSYLAGIASLLLFEAPLGAWSELAALIVWVLTLGAGFVASWKVGLFALPSALFALAWPVGAMITLSGGGLS